jgi:hypothetical protein
MQRNPRSKIQNPKSLRPPQFGLRSLLTLVAACGVLFALSRWGLSPVALAAIVFFAISVAFHVAGNAIGTRLREIGDQPEPETAEAATVRHPKPYEFAPATRLSQRSSLGWSIIVASSVGVTSGAIGGGFWTFLAGHGHVGPFNVAVGVIAFATLGGLAAFSVVSFAQVLLGAIWQAMNASAPQAPAKPWIDSKG